MLYVCQAYLWFMVLLFVPLAAAAQTPEHALAVKEASAMATDSASVPSDTVAASLSQAALADSLIAMPADTAVLGQVSDSLMRVAEEKAYRKEYFVPNPQKALWLALIIPGGGQIYNRKYWKLPIIYGGFLGCAYALTWNQQMYLDYQQAYLDIMDDDPTTDSYLDMLPPNYDITGRESQFQSIFKKRKDRYRRYRDLSIFCFVGVYIISVIDAYVDAQLSVFDISKDLTMKVQPAVINSLEGGKATATSQGNAYGLSFGLSF